MDQLQWPQSQLLVTRVVERASSVEASSRESIESIRVVVVVVVRQLLSLGRVVSGVVVVVQLVLMMMPSRKMIHCCCETKTIELLEPILLERLFLFGERLFLFGECLVGERKKAFVDSCEAWVWGVGYGFGFESVVVMTRYAWT